MKAPRVVKHRPWGGIGWERTARTIMRMWRYIGKWCIK